jgi:hypothetical protein
MTARDYLNAMLLNYPYKTEEMALQALIDSHKRMRDAEVRRGDFWSGLPTWKKKLVRFIGISFWP